jgi:bacterioferritin
MKGNAKVIECLNRLLDNELGSIDQYFTHSRMYEDWGLNKLYEHLNHELEEETDHADQLIKRILFLEGVPDLSKRSAMNIGSDVESMMRNDLAFEYKVRDDLRDAIKLCEQESDFQSREMLEKLLFDTEEDHIFWLEKQLNLISMMGIQNYIQSQMGSSTPA